MRTAASVFGADWREVDVLRVSTPDRRRACGVVEDRAEMITFGTACNALILSVRRVDDVDRRWHSGDRERYAVLRPGQWTLRDLEAAFVLWRSGERYVRGLGPACKALMTIFFEMETEGNGARDEPSPDVLHEDVEQIFEAILAAAMAADGVAVVQQIGRPGHLLMDQFLQNIQWLARSGLEIVRGMASDKNGRANGGGDSRLKK